MIGRMAGTKRIGRAARALAWLGWSAVLGQKIGALASKGDGISPLSYLWFGAAAVFALSLLLPRPNAPGRYASPASLPHVMIAALAALVMVYADPASFA